MLKRIPNLPQFRRKCESDKTRWGSIVVLAAGMIIMVFGFLAFSVDVGYIALTKAQLEAASDGGARAGVIELRAGLGVAPSKTPDEAKTAAATACVQVAAANCAGDQNSIFASATRDIRVGQVNWDPAAGTWNKQWGVTPYNMVELTLRRDQVASSNPDAPLPLFFAPVIGHDDAPLATRAVAALLPGMGFRIPSGSTEGLPYLPFTLDLGTWEALVRGDMDPAWRLKDGYAQNTETGAISKGSDGVLEANLYPEGDRYLPPGNRGTVDLGLGGNSTDEIIRQIYHGLNAEDLATFPNNTVIPPLSLDGETGVSAGFKEELKDIEGQVRLIPIFDEVHGEGDTAIYHIVKFVGATVVEVKLVGNPKRLMIQPMTFSDASVLPDVSGTPIGEDTYFTGPMLIQ